VYIYEWEFHIFRSYFVKHGVRFRSAIWIGTKIDSFRSAIPIPKPKTNRNPTLIPIPNPIANPIFNRNPNQNRMPARTKKYLAVVRNYCSTKTTLCKLKTNTWRKLTCAFVYKRQITPFFGKTWIKFKTNRTKWRRQLIINRKWRRHDLNLTILPCLVSDRRSEPIINFSWSKQFCITAELNDWFKHVMLCYVYSRTFKFCKTLQQQIQQHMLSSIPVSSTIHLWMHQWFNC